MKKTIAFLFLFLSISLAAENCKEGSFVNVFYDFDSENPCVSLIKATAKESCNMHGNLLNQVEAVVESNLQVTPIYSGEYCFLEVKSGLFKVTTDWMSEPPVATVIFSFWD